MIPYFKRFDIQVTAANQTYKEDFEVDKDVSRIEGVLLTADLDDQLYYRGTQSITINGVEFLPENYESKLLMCGTNVDPNTRYYKLESAEPINGKIKVAYTDTDNISATFTAY